MPKQIYEDINNATHRRGELQHDNPAAASHGMNVKADKRYNELLSLDRISTAIVESRNMDTILNIALDAVMETMGGIFVGILLIDEQNQTPSYRTYRNLCGPDSEKMCLEIGKGMASRIVKSRKPELIDGISIDSDTDAHGMTNTENRKVFVCVPLKTGGAILGVLNVIYTYPHRFTKDDMSLLQSIGDHTAVAIEREELYKQLQKIRERYQGLTQNIVAAQEDERKRVARELHDETSQTLSGLTCSLQVLVEMAEASGDLSDDFKKHVKKAQSIAVQIGNEVSRLMYELRPTLLDTLGLVPAIRQYAEDMLRPVGINVSVQCKGISQSILPEVEVGLFRIAQSSIGNIIKHANAENVVITLEHQPDQVLLYIRDDGKGFDVSKLEKPNTASHGTGVFGMKERVELLGGDYSVKSQLGQGTLITVKVPRTWSNAHAED
jgi:signal transduction histidine kinase